MYAFDSINLALYKIVAQHLITRLPVVLCLSNSPRLAELQFKLHVSLERSDTRLTAARPTQVSPLPRH